MACWSEHQLLLVTILVVLSCRSAPVLPEITRAHANISISNLDLQLARHHRETGKEHDQDIMEQQSFHHDPLVDIVDHVHENGNNSVAFHPMNNAKQSLLLVQMAELNNLTPEETTQLHQSLRQYSGTVKELFKLERRLESTDLPSQMRLKLAKSRVDYRHRAQRLLYHMKVLVAKAPPSKQAAANTSSMLTGIRALDNIWALALDEGLPDNELARLKQELLAHKQQLARFQQRKTMLQSDDPNEHQELDRNVNALHGLRYQLHKLRSKIQRNSHDL
eukprot:m.109467 g.109467  ORF g.109467 m.109467 type:complete len:277 (+) comp15344_c0_seq1:1-831(+)